MNSIVLLDTGVLGLLCSSPAVPVVQACKQCLSRTEDSGTTIVVPEISVYELRRELIRIQANAKLDRLDKLLEKEGCFPVTPEAWHKAAEFCALVRSGGRPTADPHALDGDAILAGVAATIGK